MLNSNSVGANKGIAPLMLIVAFASGLLALLFWFTGKLASLGGIQQSALLALIFTLNFAPAILELATKRFDPFDLKHIFLGYFFFAFTLPGICTFWFGFDPSPSFSPTVTNASLEVRSLAAILLGLTSFVAGCYLPIGERLAHFGPIFRNPSPFYVRSCAFIGIVGGAAAFLILMRSAGGFHEFISNRANWRTAGVMEGVGYLTFPVTAVLPASILLLLLESLPKASEPLNGATWGVLILSIASLLPTVVLGFRGEIVPIVLQACAVWHYARRPFPLARLILFAGLLIVVLSVFGATRDATDEDPVSRGRIMRALIFRLPGVDTIERVEWRLEQGEPYRGFASILTESTTILIPRTLWPAKPIPSSLGFSDIFFYDYFIDRGDSLDAIRSGIAPTIIGDELWVGGIRAVIIISVLLGIFARFAVEWRRLGSPLTIFVYAIFMARFPLFVEAFQGTCNSFVMYSVLTLLFVSFATLQQSPGKSARKIRSIEH